MAKLDPFRKKRAPKLFGVPMPAVYDEDVERETHWGIDFGAFDVRIVPFCICDDFTESDTWEVYVANEQVSEPVRLSEARKILEEELCDLYNRLGQVVLVTAATTRAGSKGQ